MSCNSLILANEIFGVPFDETAINAPSVRGNWVGITLAQRLGPPAPPPAPPQVSWSYSTATQAYDIAGINITATPIDLNASTGQTVYTTITLVQTGKMITVPFPVIRAGITRVKAARFRSPADFLVVVVNLTVSVARTYESMCYVMPASGSGDPVEHGPYGPIPDTQELNFCHSRTGELMMVWWGTNYLNPGRAGVVRRTSLNAIQLRDILTFNDPNASGLLGCEIQTAQRSISVFDNASRQGSFALSRMPASRNLVTAAAPQPGRLRLSESQLRLPAGSANVGFSVINDGEDYLEITGITVSGGLVTAASGLSLPACILPGDSLPVVVTRIPGGPAGTTTLTVTSIPAPTPPTLASISVNVAATASPSPAIRVEPASLIWRPSDSSPKELWIRNTGALPVVVDVPPSPTGPYSWSALPPTTVAPMARLRVATVAVSRPPVGTVPNGKLELRAIAASGTVPVPGSPFQVPLFANPADRVPVGSLRIAALVADAPGDDLLPEGEFVDIINITSQDLDLNGCRLQDLVSPISVTSPSQSSRRPRTILRFNSATMGPDTRLRPFDSTGEVLRVLTRRHSGQSDDPAPGRLRIFLDRSVAVWNNDGDTAMVFNASGEEVTILTYTSRYPRPGEPIPQNTIVQPPPARRRVMTRRIFINSAIERNTVFDVLDGDVVRIRDVTGSANFGGFLGSAGTFGPTGNGTPAGDELVSIPFRGDFPWPLPGAPQCCVIARIGTPGNEIVRPVFGGTTLTIITSEGSPVPLTLGVNDPWVADNSGFFDCAVDLYR